MATNPAARTAAAKVAAKQNGTEAPKQSSIPDDAIRPQDHLSAKVDVKTPEGKPAFEYDGEKYEFQVDVQKILKNVDFLEQLADGNLISPMKQMMGQEAWLALKKKYRDENGELEVEPHISGAFEAAMKELQAKNS